MSRKWKVAIGVIIAAVVVAGLGLLRWSGMVYRASDGERGWSLGATVYEVLGWGSEAYRSDFGWDRGMPEGGALGPERIERFGGPSGLSRGWRYGRAFGPFRVVAGLGRLAFFAVLIGLGVFLWRRQRKIRAARVNSQQEN
jgi:hypothetical protein